MIGPSLLSARHQPEGGDDDFRLTVDQKLSQLIRLDEFRGLNERWLDEFDLGVAGYFRDTVCRTDCCNRKRKQGRTTGSVISNPKPPLHLVRL